MSERTKRDWEFETEIGETGEYCLIHCNGSNIATVDGWGNLEKNTANAAQIVREHNLFPRLVEFLNAVNDSGQWGSEGHEHAKILDLAEKLLAEVK